MCFRSLLLLGSAVHIVSAAPAKHTGSLCWAVVEENIKSCLSPFLWDWGGVLNARPRLAVVPVSSGENLGDFRC